MHYGSISIQAHAQRTCGSDGSKLIHATASYIEVCTNDDLLCAEGDLRIVDREERNGYVSGALQVFIDGAFGAICSSSFDPVDAGVACRQLGFVGGTALPLAVDRRYSFTPPPVRLLLVGYMPTLGEGLVDQDTCSLNYHFQRAFTHGLESA